MALLFIRSSDVRTSRPRKERCNRVLTRCFRVLQEQNCWRHRAIEKRESARARQRDREAQRETEGRTSIIVVVSRERVCRGVVCGKFVLWGRAGRPEGLRRNGICVQWARKRVSGFNNPNRIGVIHLSLLQFIGTMTGDGEPARILLPYLQRADELQKHDHLVAYYCKSVAPLCLLSLSLSLSLCLSLSLFLCISRALVLQLRIGFFCILLRACGCWLDQGFCILFSNLSSRFCLCVTWRYGGVENCWDEVVHHTFLLFVCGNCGAGRLYAMEKGLKIPVKERTKETSALLTSLMNQLEKVHLSTSAAVCLSAIRLCMVLVVVAPIAGVKWLLNLTVYVFMQALWWSRGLSVARSNLHCFFLWTLFVYASSVCDFNPHLWCLSTLGLMIKLVKGFPFAGTERNGVVVKWVFLLKSLYICLYFFCHFNPWFDNQAVWLSGFGFVATERMVSFKVLLWSFLLEVQSPTYVMLSDLWFLDFDSFFFLFMEQSKPFEPGAPILIGCRAATSPAICSCSPLFDTVLVTFFL